MSANFIFEGPNKLRVTSFDTAAQYQIESLNFHVSTKFGSRIQVFMILKDEDGMLEIVELAKAGAINSTMVPYKLPINQKIRIGNEKVALSILVIDNESGISYTSPATRIHILTNNYTIARQVYIAQEVGAKVQDCYAKILALTEKMERG